MKYIDDHHSCVHNCSDPCIFVFHILHQLCVLFTDVNSKELCLPGNKHNNNLRLTGYNGTLKTPLKYYPPDLTCIWVITVPEGKVVKLFFIKFDLDWRGGDSCDDYVEVQDGQYASSKMLEKHCGYDYVLSAPKAIVSSGRYMRVKFSSDGFNAVRRSEGLVATFKAVNKSSECYQQMLLDQRTTPLISRYKSAILEIVQTWYEIQSLAVTL